MDTWFEIKVGLPITSVKIILVYIWKKKFVYEVKNIWFSISFRPSKYTWRTDHYNIPLTKSKRNR